MVLEMNDLASKRYRKVTTLRVPQAKSYADMDEGIWRLLVLATSQKSGISEPSVVWSPVRAPPRRG